jgi:hypothetical protein
MPNISQPPRQDEPIVTDADLAALLAGTTDPAAGLRPVADVLVALTAEPTGMELAGEAAALAEFRRRARAPVPASRARRNTAGRTRFGVKVGASVTAVAIVLGGGAAAAFADVLPAPIQRLAHDAFGAPTPSRHDLPHRGRSAVPGFSASGPPAVHSKHAARGGPGAKRARPHATPAPTAQGDPRGKGPGQQGQGSGQGHKGSGQGHKGSGQGKGNGQGQGNGQGKGSGQGKKTRPGQANGQGQQRNPHKNGSPASAQMNRRPAGAPAPAGRIGPIMDP